MAAGSLAVRCFGGKMGADEEQAPPSATIPAWKAAPASRRWLRRYLARLKRVEGTQPSLPSSSLTFHHMPSFSPVG